MALGFVFLPLSMVVCCYVYSTRLCESRLGLRDFCKEYDLMHAT